ncbi:uncharacterized protein COLE_05591 [Cutaneotrichosporon oleaginosum]|uniref:uncharacterized protein n=1 Tax=Cutaneotrichosporon oleaginosum TaxID=879819 RepID=UPI0013272978|nr:hypothetical protein COLE_05591 [Cutaneotrichosporon oleaginosum]
MSHGGIHGGLNPPTGVHNGRSPHSDSHGNLSPHSATLSPYINGARNASRASISSTYSVYSHASYHVTTHARPSYSGPTDYFYHAVGTSGPPHLLAQHTDSGSSATNETTGIITHPRRRWWQRVWPRARAVSPSTQEGGQGLKQRRRRLLRMFCKYSVRSWLTCRASRHTFRQG